MQLFCSVIFLGFWGISNVSLTVFRHKREHYEPNFQRNNFHPPMGFPPGGPDAYFQYPGRTAHAGMSLMESEEKHNQLERTGVPGR